MAIVSCVWNLIHPFPFLRQRTCSILLSLFQEMRYGMARVFVTRCFNFSTAFTEDWLIHLWEQDLSEVVVLDEISNSQLFSSAYIFNSQTWISTRILRVCKREFRALLSTFYAPEGNLRASGFFLCRCLCVNGNNWFYYITLGKTYCQSSRRLYVSETSLPYGLVVYINLFIACFVQASDDRLLKMRIDHHNQQLLRLINRLFPIIGTSLRPKVGVTVSAPHFRANITWPSVYNAFALSRSV